MLAALGAWLGCMAVLEVFFYGAIAGAVMSIALIAAKKYKPAMMSVWHDMIFFVFTRTRPAVSKKKKGIPYSAPVATGFLFYVIISIYKLKP